MSMTNETNQTTLFGTSPANGKSAASAPNEERPGYQFVKRVGWIPDDWQAVPFGEVVVSSRYGISESSDDDGAIPMLRMNGIEDGQLNLSDLVYVNLSKKEFKKHRIKRGELLFNRTNSYDLVGKTTVFDADGDYVCASYLVRFTLAADDFLPRYASYYFNTRSAKNRLKAIATKGVSQANINPTVLQKHFLVVLPSLPEQRKIARKLGAWDRALADLDALIETKRRQKKGLAQRLLPGRVRLPGFGGAELAKTKIGAVPSDWREVRFGKVFKRKSEKNKDSAIDHVITVGKYAIRPQSEHFDKSVASADLSNYNVIRPGDFVYDPMSAYYGAIGRYDYDEPGIVSPVYRVLKLRRGFDSGFVKHLLNAHYVRYRIASYSTQGNKEGKRRGLQHSAFNAIPVYVPSEKEQHQIAVVLDSADAEIAALEDQRDALARQKKGLMQRLLTGEVRVTPDVEDPPLSQSTD